MFELLSSAKETRRLFECLYETFSPGALKSVQTLSSPGGQIHKAEILHRKDLGVWAFIRTKPDEQNIFHCSLGVGEPSWQPAVEISVPVQRNRHCYGQLVADEGGVFLAHRGALGGGKFSVKIDDFRKLIQGYCPDDVRDGKRVLQYFVLGSVDNPKNLIGETAGYVREAARIRKLRRNEQKFGAILNRFGGVSRDYKPEKKGKGTYLVDQVVTFERLHAEVHEALATQISVRKLSRGNDRLDGGIGPDLYTLDELGRMKHLFEIKVGDTSQSIFTAIGQLIVYSAGQSPKLILVAPALPKSANFQMALRSHKISLLKYTIAESGEITFHGLDKLLI